MDSTYTLKRRQYYHEHRAEILKKQKAYVSRNREKVRQYMKQYHASMSPEAKKRQYEQHLVWLKKNPHKMREYNKRVKAKRIVMQHAFIRSYKTACASCGEDNYNFLDFHHRDPSTKKGIVSRIYQASGEEAALAEIAKCTVLCKTCHRAEHKKMPRTRKAVICPN